MTRPCLSATLGAALLAVLAVDAAFADAAPTPVVTVASAARPFEASVRLRGRTEADRRVDVPAEIAGLVASEPIRKGARMARGDVLCRLDPGERPAALAEAEADLRKAQLQFDASERLSARGFAAETDAATRSAELEAARASLERARIAMDRLAIVAPFDGVLESDTAERGALLLPGSTCATLIALDPIVLVGYASERDVDRLTVGAPATARLVTGRIVEGAIRFVSRAAEETTRTYRVEVAAPNADISIRDGMTAEIGVDLPAGVAHFLPQSALTLDDEGRLGVRIVVEGRATFAPVSILRDARDGVWLGGLPEAAEVIVVGQEFVGEGAPVAPVPSDEAGL